MTERRGTRGGTSRVAAVACALTLLATGCATRKSVRQLQADVSALRTEVATLRQAEEILSRQTANYVADLKSMEARSSELDAQVKRMSGEAEQLRGRLETLQDAIKQTRTLLEARTAPATPPPGPSNLSPEDGVGRARSPEAAYAAALANFRAREYGQAVLDFLDLVAKYPKHALAGSAQYWIGEAYYVQHDYRQALIEFQKAMDREVASAKAADARLKIGLCYANLREPAHAREFWQRVVRDFPGSDAAARARTLLRGRGAPTGR